jgi:three-Cys-motif partner protein
LKSKPDPYQWTKRRIKLLYDNVRDWDDLVVTTPNLDVWSIKKVLALEYYILPFIKIMRSTNFNKVYYVDPFCGSGVMKLKKKYLFPGSPLVPLSHIDETPFHEYYLSDNNGARVTALKEHIERLSIREDIGIHANKSSFSDVVEELFSGEKPTNWKERGYLVFLDPYGLEVDWKNMERILTSGAVDIIFTFMTWAIVWNQNNKHAEDKLTKYFGNPGWKDLVGPQAFVANKLNDWAI